MLTPRASRPDVPAGYGIAAADEGKGLLPWSWADERLRGKRDVWGIDVSEMEGPVFLVRPKKVFGFIDEDDGFPLNATRWEFD